MAAIVTDDDFVNAASEWQKTQTLPAGRSWFQDKTARKIYQEIPGQPNEDVTPALAVLEAALDTYLQAQQVEAEREEARALLIEAKEYIRTQLESDTPATQAQQVAVLLPYVSGVNANDFLTKRMNKLIGLANTAYGFSPALTLTPAAQPHYARWLEVFIQMVSIET